MYVSPLEKISGNINTCKVTENNEFIFSNDYLKKRLDTLQFYMNPIITKNLVSKVIISHKSLLSTIEKLLKVYTDIMYSR